MKKLLRRRRMKKNSASPFSVNENQPINDNLYLAAASQAAVADKASGAYDEFLFNDDGIRTTPFENAVDRHSELLSYRLEESMQNAVLASNRRVSRAEVRVEKAIENADSANRALAEVEISIEHEMKILAGEIPGEHEVYWPAATPEMASRWSSNFQVLYPWVIFAFVGLADLLIFVVSLGPLFPHGGQEVRLFAIPAVGIQVGFPHLVGHRIAWLLRGSKRKRVDLAEMIAIGLAWLVFCECLTQVRMNYIKSTSSLIRKNHGHIADFTEIMTLLMIVGLGAILIFTSARRNPHQTLVIRLQLRRERLRRNLLSSRNLISDAKAELEIAQADFVNAKERFESAVLSSNALLAEAAKSVYRRALINSMSSTNFTSAYQLANSGELKSVSKPSRLSDEGTHVENNL